MRSWQPLVSILIPAYNAERTVADSIRSALAQSWSSKEIIVVDDGSTDGTLRAAQEFACRNVHVVHQQNGGAAAARNTALSVCQGDYIQWLDADDLLSVHKVSSQMRLFVGGCGPRTLASCAWGYFRCRPWKARFESNPLWRDLRPVDWMVSKWETNSYMQTATWLVSRDLTEEAGPWNTNLLGDDDGEYFSRIVLRSEGVKFVPNARVYYRVSPSTRLSYIGSSTAKMDAQFLGMELQIRYLRSACDDDRTRAACTKYLETWMLHFYPNRPDILERASGLARTWGAELRTPRLSWKYNWIQQLFGWPAAKQVQCSYNEAKSTALRAWDRALLKTGGGAIDVAALEERQLS